MLLLQELQCFSRSLEWGDSAKVMQLILENIERYAVLL
jgi:hypothetical protein